MFAVQAAEFLFFDVEVEFYTAGGAVAVFFDENVGDVTAVGFGVIVVLSIDKCYDVGVLFDAVVDNNVIRDEVAWPGHGQVKYFLFSVRFYGDDAIPIYIACAQAREVFVVLGSNGQSKPTHSLSADVLFV